MPQVGTADSSERCEPLWRQMTGDMMADIPPAAVPEFRIRPFQEADAGATLGVFTRAVRVGAKSAYTQAQRNAWLGHPDVLVWAAHRRDARGWVAEPLAADVPERRVLGFVELLGDEVAMLFVDPDATRRGIGRALLHTAVEHARTSGSPAVTAHVSLVAEPVFARAGFAVVERQQVSRAGQALSRAVMRLPII